MAQRPRVNKPRVLFVVDGFFSLGPQDINDRSFSLSWLISILKRNSNFLLDTAHRGGDHSAAIWGKFNFATSVDLDQYDQIWLMGFGGWSKKRPANPISDDELLVLAEFMNAKGGIYAVGDHDSLGSDMAGNIIRVRTMRKWYGIDDPGVIPSEPYKKYIPFPDQPRLRNNPQTGPERGDTLRKDSDGKFHFTNQSDDIPQPLELLPFPGVNETDSKGKTYHPIFNINKTTGEVLDKFPDHMHEGDTLGFGGDEASYPPSLDEEVTLGNKKFVEYPVNKDGKKEKPWIIARGEVIGGHETTVEPNKLCESGFEPDTSITRGKLVNTLCAYDGHKVGVGRIITDSSWHHLLDLNLIGDPCATEKTQGFDNKFLKDMEQFFINCVYWLSNPRVFKTQ